MVENPGYFCPVLIVEVRLGYLYRIQLPLDPLRPLSQGGVPACFPELDPLPDRLVVENPPFLDVPPLDLLDLCALRPREIEALLEIHVGILGPERRREEHENERAQEQTLHGIPLICNPLEAGP